MYNNNCEPTVFQSRGDYIDMMGADGKIKRKCLSYTTTSVTAAHESNNKNNTKCCCVKAHTIRWGLKIENPIGNSRIMLLYRRGRRSENK